MLCLLTDNLRGRIGLLSVPVSYGLFTGMPVIASETHEHKSILFPLSGHEGSNKKIIHDTLHGCPFPRLMKRGYLGSGGASGEETLL
jgi:hypothetical protein